MIGDFYGNKFEKQTIKPWDSSPYYPTNDQLVQAQILELRKEIYTMKELLKKAIEYDKANNQPHCENDVKIEFLKQVAESLGVTLDDIFPSKKPEPPKSRIRKEHQEK